MEICAACKSRILNCGIAAAYRHNYDSIYFQCSLCSNFSDKVSNKDLLIYLKAGPVPCDFSWRQSVSLFRLTCVALTEEDFIFVLGSLRCLIRYKESANILDIMISTINYGLICTRIMNFIPKMLHEWRDEDGNTFMHLLSVFCTENIFDNNSVYVNLKAFIK